MGLGVIALKDIPKRTLILKESPQFVVHGMWDKFGNVNAFDPKLMSSFNQMVKDDQKEFLNLRSDREAPFELLKIVNIYDVSTLHRLGKTGSLGPWRRVIGSLHYAKMILIFGDHFLHSEGLLQCTMTLLQGPKDPVLPNLMKIHSFK